MTTESHSITENEEYPGLNRITNKSNHEINLHVITQTVFRPDPTGAGKSWSLGYIVTCEKVGRDTG